MAGAYTWFKVSYVLTSRDGRKYQRDDEYLLLAEPVLPENIPRQVARLTLERGACPSRVQILSAEAGDIESGHEFVWIDAPLSPA